MFQSTRLTRGATVLSWRSGNRFPVTRLLPGATQVILIAQVNFTVSIHAPRTGATPILQRYWYPYHCFNPRASRRARQSNQGSSPKYLPVSIHALTRGATL